ncbi:MAG: hypothetical protein RLZZ69_3811, partial [Cyanobacteriota bacterium]
MQGAEQLICYLLSQIHTILPVSYESTIKSPANIKSTFQRMMSILNWQSWSFLSRSELIYTFTVILQRMWHWSNRLTPEYLQSCCASPDFFGNNNPIVVELGCGKGEYTIGLAAKNPDKNYIGIDIKGARFWRGAKT